MATRELAEIKDKNGDVNELRDKKLADSIAKNTVVNTDNVRMVDTNGKEVFIARDSFISAIRNVLGGFILSNTKAEAPNIPVFDSNGDFGAITAANLASVLGGSINPNETLNISLTQVCGDSADLIGASVTITDDDTGDTLYTATWNGTTITTEIDVNTNYTVSVETIACYLACAPQSYQAGYQTTRNISFQYRASGAFVEATDGTLYKASQWLSSGKTANSVVLITSTMQIRIAITKVDKPIGNSPTGAIENFMTAITDESAAKLDYNGKSNTDKIVQFNISEGTNTTDYAAPYCKAFTFPNGNGNAYLAASGQIWIIYQNKTEINNCLTACNGTTLASVVNTSTYSGQDPLPYRYVWQIGLSDGVFARTNGEGLKTIQQVRPISDYE